MWLHVLDIKDTLDLILETPKSFCRVGDGELNLINGGDIPFQKYSEDLARRLREILASSNDKCYVGIDGRYFGSTLNILENFRNYTKINGKWIREALLKHCNRKRLYIGAAFTCPSNTFSFDSPEYVECITKIKELFRGRNLVIFSGATVFDKIKYNVFEFAASRVHIFANSKNAWAQYNEIMTTARKFPKENYTLCFILGPTATVAAYDLAQEGYTAWDIGHMAKEYDYYRKFLQGEKISLQEFFVAD